MPTHAGPWVTPPPQTADLPGGVLGTNASTVTDTDFAALCASTSSAATATDLDGRYFYGTGKYWLSQKVLTFQFNTPPTPYSPPLPPGAIGVEYEGDTTFPASFAWITSMSVPLLIEDETAAFGVTAEDVDLLVVSIHPAEFVYSLGLTSPPNHGMFLPASDLAGRSGITATFPAASASVTINVPLAPSDVDMANAGYRPFQFVLAYAAQLTATPPCAPGGTTGRVVKYHGDNATWTQQAITATYQPPRYRFIYPGLPPLRQFPRDDALGGTPRQGHQSRSVQASAREGWAGTYR